MATLLRSPLGFRPQQKRPIPAVDSFSRALTLGINPNAAIAQLSDSAPRPKPRVHTDVYPNLLTSTLDGIGPAVLELPVMSGRLIDSANVKRWQTETYEVIGFVVYDGPEAAILQLSDSAPRVRKELEAFQPPNLLTHQLGQTVAYEPPLMCGRVDQSAPWVKYQVRVEALSRPLTLGINPPPMVGTISDSATPPKRPAYPFDPPNLICQTLAEPLELPRRATRLDWSAPPPKRPAYPFDPLNNLVFRDQTNFVWVPYLIGKTEDAATARIEAIYCTASVTGSTGTVTAQSPAHMTLVARGTVVSITLGGDVNSTSGNRSGWPPYGMSQH